MNSKFNFTGLVSIPKETSKRPFCKVAATRNNRPSLSLNFGIKVGSSSLGFVEAFDFERDTIKTMNTNNEKIEINWADRLDKGIIETIASYKKYSVDLGEDFGGRREFITLYDTINYLQEILPQYTGKVTVIGQLVKDWYNGKYIDRFKLQNVYAASNESKSSLTLFMDIYYNKSSIDKSEFKDTEKIYLNGYIEQYVSADEGIKYIPQQLVFCSSKYKLENPSHKKHLDYKMRFIDVAQRSMQHMLWEVVLLSGAEEVEFDDSMLTDSQREQIELGFKTLDDFRPRGNIFGNKLYEYRLKLPSLKGEYSDGIIDTGIKEAEFADRIYVPNAQDESIRAAHNNSDAKQKTDEPPFELDNSIDEDDMF